MGNRAVIAFKSKDHGKHGKNQSPAIYLHWNGSPYAVEGFLKAAKEFGIRGDDPGYCMARLTQVIGNAIGGTLSLGVGCYGNFGDPGDNGVYWIKNWEVVEHNTDYPDSPPNEKWVEECYQDTFEKWVEECYQDTLNANKEHFKQGDKVA